MTRNYFQTVTDNDVKPVYFLWTPGNYLRFDPTWKCFIKFFSK